MMTLTRFRPGAVIGLVLLLAACATPQPADEPLAPETPPEESQPRVNETAMLPMLGY